MQNPPPGQPSYGAPPPTQKSGLGLEPNIAAALSYIWIVGLIFFFIEKENRFIRFHAMQSIIFGIANTVVMFVLIIIGIIFTVLGAAVASTAGDAAGSLFGLIISLVWLFVWLVPIAFLIGLILTAVKAYQGKTVKLPIIGNMAEKIVNK
ncbi:MAG TPA: DUF4870 domain-containing protein [Pyrinomonadaceae bacterium]|nr:DUF4870 domain-containing protein [Pyrinomonadaceae bacterium]